MQRPGEPGAARFGPPEGCADHRPHRYRSFMIEEILTEPPGPKGAAPAAAAAAAGELLKFGVQALLAARPFHSHLGTCGAGGRGALAGLGGRKRAAASAGRSSGHAGPGSFLRRVPGREAKGAGAGPRRNQASCPWARPAGRAFALFFTATLWFPAPRSPARGPEPASPSRALDQTANVRLRVKATSGRGRLGLRHRTWEWPWLPKLGKLDLDGRGPCV